MVTRRAFNTAIGAGFATAALGGPALAKPEYNGPNVVLIRFGGGVRRHETIELSGTYAPYMMNSLAPRGVLIPDMRIDKLEGVNTSHAEGTLNILTGRYLAYRDTGSTFFSDRMEPTEPTLFEYFRSAYDIPSHQVLLINGEDRPQEEFFTYGVNEHYGINFRSEMLSLHRFKLYKFREVLAEGTIGDAAQAQVEKQYRDLLAIDERTFTPKQSPQVERFWQNWRASYGDDGFKNPRGDRLLTALALRAMKDLQPRLMMINYQDPDYVHWGNPSHYTRAISVIDEGISQIVAAVDADPFYRDNTVFIITPDCGRDANALMDVPFQHHFNTRSAHEIWALIFGAGISRNRVMDRAVDQSAIAATVAGLMGFTADRAEGDALSGIAI